MRADTNLAACARLLDWHPSAPGEHNADLYIGPQATVFNWRGELDPAERLVPSASAKKPWNREDWHEQLEHMRERLRWLYILCDGLYKHPVLVPSGERMPRQVTRHIVHPAQTQQDALNEVAASLVNPPQRFVAHVRLPGGYHLVRLASPLDCPENSAQLQQVRVRSQQRYPCPEDLREGLTPGERADSQTTPLLGRRPGGWQELSNDVPADDEDAS